MIVLAIDTCDWRGSVAVLQDERTLGVVSHDSREDYSSWLLPAVGEVLEHGGLRLGDMEAYAVASGPGSFTGVRVGLTTVKAWSEVYAKPVAAVSRMEAIAAQAVNRKRAVAAFVDAQRGQVFGSVYRGGPGCLSRIGQEMVISPGNFVEEAIKLADDDGISWVSPDPDLLIGEAAWKERERRGERIERVPAMVAGLIGRIGLRLVREGKTTDALSLDANYVRRSDAEIFWKGASPLSEKLATNSRHGK